MKLRRLEIAGFKSFADPMVIDFNAAITGIIGPNGCGKSNVVDAIRWVMGELSAKQLRGSAMADVIFNGTEKRGPLGLAEVTLTLSGDGSDMPAAYRDYHELAVRRRLYSNGESEYFINKTKVRLRDIQDLFLDTGVGTKGAYAIIEQGRIGSIIMGQAEERRRMIDEVAGISKFKNRRLGAERRLESTMQSLSRLEDMVADLQRRANTLRKQAEQARRYKRLKDELALLEQQELVLDYLEAAAQLGYYDRQVAAKDGCEAAAGMKLSLAEAELTSLNLQKTKEDDKLQQLTAIRQHIVTRSATLERDILHGRQELELSVERQQNLEHDAAEAREQLARLEQNSAALDTEVAELRQQLAAREQVLAAKSERLTALQEQHLAQQREADRLAVAMLQAVEEITREQNSMEMLARQRESIGRRQEESRQALDELAAEEAAVGNRQGDLAREVRQSLAIIEEYNFQHDELRAENERLAAKSLAQKERVDDLNTRLTRVRAQWESLEEIERRHDGYAAGIQALLDERAAAGLDSLLVKDLLVTPGNLELAVEALLGEWLQYIAVTDSASAAADLDLVKEKQWGKAGFLLPGTSLPVAAETAAARAAGCHGTLADALTLLPAGEGLRPFLERVLIFEDLPAALAAAPQLAAGRLTALTLAGDVLEDGVILRGGDRQAVSSGVLSRRRQLGELAATIEDLEGQQVAAQQDYENIIARVEANRLRLDELAAAINRENLHRIGLEKERQAAVFEAERISERREQLTYELDQGLREAENFAAQIAACQEKVAAAQQTKNNLAAQQGELKASTLGQDIYSLSEECSRLKVVLAEYGQKLASALAAQSGRVQSREELQARYGRLLARCEKEQASRQECQRQLARDEEEARLYAEQGAKAEAEVSLQQEKLTALAGKLAAGDSAVRLLREEYAGVSRELAALRLAQEKWRLSLRQLAGTAQTFHQRPISDLLYEHHLRPLPDRDWAQHKKELQAGLAGIGAVNLLAIEESAQTEAKLQFLQGQRDDLQRAIDDLHQAIARIEQSSKARFKEAFNAVNEAFKKVFTKLFNGGQAELVLLDEESPLDGGLDIIASPPGKRLQNLTLMSGGEKALTAAALVFALFLVHPSPFCLLDEVDAPLDEANIGRFLDLIKELSSETQFVVITHNQQTMGAAQVVYGVTMEERGVSKVLSIKLNARE